MGYILIVNVNYIPICVFDKIYLDRQIIDLQQ